MCNDENNAPPLLGEAFSRHPVFPNLPIQWQVAHLIQEFSKPD